MLVYHASVIEAYRSALGHRRDCVRDDRAVVKDGKGCSRAFLTHCVFGNFRQASFQQRRPGRWSGQSGKELSGAPFRHPEMERQAMEVGVGQWWFSDTNTALAPISCRRAVVNRWRSQLIPIGRVPSIVALGRCLQLRERATIEQETGAILCSPKANPKRRRRHKGMCLEDRPVLEPNAAYRRWRTEKLFVAVASRAGRKSSAGISTFTEDLERLTGLARAVGVNHRGAGCHWGVWSSTL